MGAARNEEGLSGLDKMVPIALQQKQNKTTARNKLKKRRPRERNGPVSCQTSPSVSCHGTGLGFHGL